MSICKTDALVLRSQPFGETSKIVTLYAKGFGRLTVMAKGARKPKSKFGASLEPVTESAIVFYRKESREIQTLSQGDILHDFPHIKGSLERLSYASALCELLDRLAAEEEPNFPLYRAAQDALCGMDGEGEVEAEKYFWHFQLKAAGASGYSPQLARCVSCEGAINADRVGFSHILGGALCPRCADRDTSAMGIHLGTIRFLSRLCQIDAKGIGPLKPTEGLRREVRAVLNGFLEYHTDDHRGLRSLRVLDEITASPDDSPDRLPSLYGKI